MIKKEIALLWSGGLDSTIMLAYLCTLGSKVTCYHILIRNGCGKDIRETKAIKNLLVTLQRKYRFDFIELKHRIRPCDDRNLKMINFVASREKTSNIAIGVVKSVSIPNGLPRDDIDYKTLEKNSGRKIVSWDTLGYKTEEKIYNLGMRLLGKETLKKTWSCQLWWKKPCGKCYSCKRRETLIG